jgi:DNA polymerase I-like protein with 3'-5' exonuclease and polymerase domains
LIKPPKGMSVAYIDWTAQEVAIAAATFRDEAMMYSYRRGDSHLELGKDAGLIPSDATKKTHPQWREILKTCVFGTFYGMGEKTLAFRIGKHHFEARAILEAHQGKYPVFWTGLRGAVDYALLTGSLHTRYGWHVHVDRDTNPRSLQNYLMQANGAEMMRIAACLATERGLSICPIHDAFLLTAPTEHIERDIAILRECMAEAGRAVLDGFEVRTSVERVDYPNRFMDEKRGRVMWDRVNKLLAQCQREDVA